MKPKYWHNLSIGAQKALQHSHMTYGEFMMQYSQPDWCKYPIALGGGMGCWSLTIPGRIRHPEDCHSCELKKWDSNTPALLNISPARTAQGCTWLPMAPNWYLPARSWAPNTCGQTSRLATAKRWTCWTRTGRTGCAGQEDEMVSNNPSGIWTYE